MKHRFIRKLSKNRPSCSRCLKSWPFFHRPGCAWPQFSLRQIARDAWMCVSRCNRTVGVEAKSNFTFSLSLLFSSTFPKLSFMWEDSLRTSSQFDSAGADVAHPLSTCVRHGGLWVIYCCLPKQITINQDFFSAASHCSLFEATIITFLKVNLSLFLAFIQQMGKFADWMTVAGILCAATMHLW